MTGPAVALLGPTPTGVLLAVLRGARVYSEIMEVTGFSRRQVKVALDRLADEDLVDWEEGTLGTLTAKVAIPVDALPAILGPVRR